LWKQLLRNQLLCSRTHLLCPGCPDLLCSGRSDLLRSRAHLLRPGPELLRALLQEAVVLRTAACQAAQPAPSQQVLPAQLRRADLLHSGTELRCPGPELLRPLNLIDRCENTGRS